jgi:four helix bundle protein
MSVGYRELIVWQKAMDLAEEVYSLTKQLPKTELYSLADQMKRAAVSVPSNIAEGQQRRSPKEFLIFLSVARGSLAELETQIMLCERFGYLNGEQTDKANNLSKEIGLMLLALMKTLEE